MQSEKKNWITNSLTESLIKFSKKNKNIVVLDADLSDDLNLKNLQKSSQIDLFKMELQNKIWFPWQVVLLFRVATGC